MAEIEGTDSGRIVLRLAEGDREVLVSLAEQVVDFVSPTPRPDEDPLAALVGIDEHARRPADPALARLLPEAYRHDQESADDFRRFTERPLREGKVANARAVLADLEEAGEKVVLSDGDVGSWLGFLTDTRLILGTRLEVTDDEPLDLDDLDDDDPRLGLAQVYGWLTYLQDGILQRLLA